MIAKPNEGLYMKVLNKLLISLNTTYLLCLLFFLIILTAVTNAQRTPLPIDSSKDYLVYYGSWNQEKLFRAKDFDLVILEPSNITAAQISELKKGHDGIKGTDDDVIVIGYISIGEDHIGNRTGDGRGPCYYDYSTSQIVYTNNGYASWYLDDADRNNLPDQNSIWGSYYVNVGDSLWRDFLKNNPAGIDNTLVIKGCDGLFLDTIDSASPYSTWPYRWMVVQMSELVGWIRQTYPDKYLIANRGLFYFDPDLPTAYQNSIRPYIDADMFESYYEEYDRQGWAQKVNNEANKPDGFKVIALDYIDPAQTSQINQQISEVFSYNWGNYISRSALDVIRYDVFHKHTVDQNPPTWNTAIGIISAQAINNAVIVKWKELTDQSLPLKFNIYYSTQLPFNINNATKISNVNATFDSVDGTFSFTVTGLNNFIKYYFIVRAEDAVGNEDKNLQIVSSTPPSGTSSLINIDGFFDDWINTPLFDQPPNPIESAGDVTEINADFRDIWITNDTSNLYLSYDLQGSFSSSYFYHIFLDTDMNALTGYRYQDSSSIGAELMVENNSLWQYTGSGGSNWSWAPLTGLQKVNSGNRTELSIPLNHLGQAQTSKQLRLIFQDNLSIQPYSLIDIAPDDFANHYFEYFIHDLIDNINWKDNVTTLPLFFISQNYPNPFNSSTNIQITIPQNSFVRLKVYNILGEEIATLINNQMTAGKYIVKFNGDDLPSGTYFYSLVTEDLIITRKMTLIK